MTPSDKTLYDYFREYAEDSGTDTFIFDERQSFTAKQAFDICKSLAAQFDRQGIRNGTTVAIKTERNIKSIFVFFALQFIGAVADLRDPRESIDENIKVVGDVLHVGKKQCVLSFSAEADCNIVPAKDSKAPTIIIYTSGSTSVKKAVKLSQYNFINNALDSQCIGGTRADDVHLLIVPVHHVFGLVRCIAIAVSKYSLFVPETVGIDYILDCMEKYRITRLSGVPSLYLAMAERRGNRKLYLNCGLVGGSPCSKEQFLKIEKALGLTLVPVYGMSECIGISIGTYTDSVDDRCDSVGRIYSMNTVVIADDGEVLVKSPSASAACVESDGYVHTGDLGYIDGKGFLHVIGRKKDIIIRNGNNLSTAAIQSKILSLPQVKDVCVVGLIDERQGEVPCALIVADGDVTDELKTVLNKNEIPQHIKYTSSIPLTATGKPDKQAIKNMFAENQ